MKAYPLIYSRTKNVDFVPDFLTRPADLDCKTALRYVSSAMSNLDTLKAIRYSTFSVGNYCICGGVSCISKVLVEELKTMSVAADFMLDSVSEYLSDCKGRSIACFIGFAIPKSEVRSGKIPDVRLEDYWTNYLDYLKHQWDKEKTESEKISFPPIDLREKTYSSLYAPTMERMCNKGIVMNFHEKPQDALDYFFNEILNKGDDKASFISDINYQSDFENTVFSNVHVSTMLYSKLKYNMQAAANRTNTSQSNYNANPSGTSMRSPSVASKRNEYSQRSHSSDFSTHSASGYTDYNANHSKKKAILPLAITVVALLVILIVVLLAIL